MTPPDSQNRKSVHLIWAAGLVVLAIVVHPRLSSYFIPEEFMPKLRDLLWLSSIILLGMGVMLAATRRSPLNLWRENAWFNVWAFFFLLGIALCTN